MDDSHDNRSRYGVPTRTVHFIATRTNTQLASECLHNALDVRRMHCQWHGDQRLFLYTITVSQTRYNGLCAKAGHRPLFLEGVVLHNLELR